MNPEKPVVAEDVSVEVAALIARLHETGQRLEELTAGEVDTVADRAGQTFVLRRAQEQLRHNEAARQAAILDALPTHIALLDPNGSIISVNAAWRQFADANGLHSPGHAVGVNYLAICDAARGPDSREAHQVALGIRSVLREERKSFSIEYSCNSPNQQRWFLMTVTPLSSGHPTGVVVMHLNITQRKQIESSLQRNQSELQALFDLMPAMIWFKDTSNGILRVNKLVAQAAGKSVAEIEGKPSLQIYPQDAAKFYADDLEVIRSGSAKLEIVETLENPDGTKRWMQTDKVPYFDQSNNVIGIVVMARDITERKQNEEELRASESRYRYLFDANPLPMWVYDLQTLAFLAVNEAAVEHYGYSREQFLAMSITDIRPSTDVSAFRQSLLDLSAGIQHSGTFHHRKGDGKIIDVEVTSHALNFLGRRARLVLANDVTERNRSVQALHQALIRLNEAQRIGQIGDWGWDFASKAFTWSPQVFEILGRDPTHGPPRDRAENATMYDAPSAALMEEKIALAIDSGERQECDLLAQRPDGEQVHVHAVAVPEKNESGSVFRMHGTIQDVTARTRLSAAIRESERRYHSLFDNMLEGYAYCQTVFDGDQLCDFIYVEVNSAFQALTGLKDVVGKKISNVIPGIRESQHELFEIYGRVALTGEPKKFEIHLDALGIWLSVTAYSNDREHFVAVFEDISTRKLAQQALQASEAEQRHIAQQLGRLNRVYALLSEINNLIVHVRDREELFTAACKIAIEAGGFRMSFIGTIEPGMSKVTVAASAGKDEELLTAVKNTLSSSDVAPSTMVMRAIREKKAMVANDSLKDPRLLLGEKYSKAGVRSLALLPLVVTGEAVGIFALYASVPDFFHEEEMKLLSELAANIAFAIDHIKKGERLNYLAYYDALTGLSNRTLFLDRVAQSMRHSAVASTKLSMVLLDLDRFKQVNDNLGLSAGDALLVWVAARLTRTLGDAGLLARVGADEFALVILEEKREGDVARFLERTTRALHEDTLSFEGTVIRVTARFGIAQFPEDGVDAAVLFKNAEIALKLAKSSGESIAYFSNEMNARNTQRLELEEQLRAAIDARQFVLYYQPKVDMISGGMVGAEALIRWQHPHRGLLGPAEFIGLAEETGLIVRIGSWVIDAVCAQQAAWIAAGLHPVPIAVNLAAAQFDKDDLLQTVRSALAAHSIEAGLLDLELTESAVMSNSAMAAITLQSLRKLGLGLALDDFGTGYSSLAHLKRFPFNSVKIDRSFVIDITRNAEDAAIAVAIIAMAHSLKLKVVAEGIETQGQFNYLCTHGCDQMQGNLFSPAVTSEAFESDLRSGRRMHLPPTAPADVRTLLLVDDEPHICAALARMLRPDGYRILTAHSGLEGLDLLSVNSVQVIISDQRMPGMSGTEFLNTVRQLHPETLRIILSGYTDLAVVTEAVNRGAVFKFLTKPWDDEILRETVRDAFRRYRPESDIARNAP